MVGRSQNTLFWLFLLPTLLLLAIIMYYPMFGTVFESLHETSFLSQNGKFVGFKGYAKIFASRDFPEIVANSVAWTVGVVALQNLLGFAVALLLNQNLPGQGLMRALVLLPWILPGVVGAILWRFMYDPQLGLINSLLLSADLIDANIAWLADTSSAMMAVIMAAVWKGFPFSTLIFLAALQRIDQSQIEAAVVDGASAWRRLIDVILPGMRDVILINVVLTTILTFNYFDMVWVLTRGGPKNATHIFPTKIFEVGFGQFRFGAAAIYGVCSIVVLVVLVLLYVLLQRSGTRREVPS